ncbi:MAG: class I SAM-dependent methyltransferase [Gemmataceae bacterium]
MSTRSHVPPTPLTPELYDYSLRVGLREPDVIRELREETALLPNGEWSIAPEQGPILALFVGLIQARNVLEIGTFTGASTIWLARALPPGGRVLAMDVSEEYTAIARRYWAKAGVSDRIELKLQPAIKTLDGLVAAGKASTYDLAFIDADKGNVGHYYDRALELVRPGGLILIDNTLWDGKPADAQVNDESTVAIRELNARLHTDSRIELCFLTVSDGLTVCRKR